MKLALILVSIALILASGYVAWWMITQADYEWEAPLRGGDEITGYTILTPEHETLANIGRWGSVLVPVLGILLLSANLSKKENRRPIIIITVITGIFAAVLAFFTILWGFPSTFSTHGGEQLIKVFASAAENELATKWIITIEFAAALAALGVGIAQLVKWKKIQSI